MDKPNGLLPIEMMATTPRAPRSMHPSLMVPLSRAEIQEEHIIVGEIAYHELMVNYGKLWAHALGNCVVSACKTVCKFWRQRHNIRSCSIIPARNSVGQGVHAFGPVGLAN